MGVLFPLIHFLLELLGLFVVCERQSRQTFFEFESVKVYAILVVTEAIVYFLIPDDSSVIGLHVISLLVSCLRTTY